MWAERITGSAIAGQLTGARWASPAELAAIAAAWRRWSNDPDAILVIPQVELLHR